MQLIARSERKIGPNFVKKISSKFYTENLLMKKESFKIVSLLQEMQLMNLVKLEKFLFFNQPLLGKQTFIGDASRNSDFITTCISYSKFATVINLDEQKDSLLFLITLMH